MARLIVWAVIILVLARLAWQVLRGVFEGMGYQPPRSKGQSVGLVRDPICGVFIVPSKALTAGSGAATRYFCSEKCRQEYARHA